LKVSYLVLFFPTNKRVKIMVYLMIIFKKLCLVDDNYILFFSFDDLGARSNYIFTAFPRFGG
jgi:hypothetical protein